MQTRTTNNGPGIGFGIKQWWRVGKLGEKGMCDPLEMETWGEDGQSWWVASELGKRLGDGLEELRKRLPFSLASPRNLFKMYSMCCVHCVYAFVFCHDHAKIRMWRSEENL